MKPCGALLRLHKKPAFGKLLLELGHVPISPSFQSHDPLFNRRESIRTEEDVNDRFGVQTGTAVLPTCSTAMASGPNAERNISASASNKSGHWEEYSTMITGSSALMEEG